MVCEQNFLQASSAVPTEEVKQNISWEAWKNKVPRCLKRTKRDGKQVFEHKCDNTFYYGWPAARAALLLLSDHELPGLSQVLLWARFTTNIFLYN